VAPHSVRVPVPMKLMARGIGYYLAAVQEQLVSRKVTYSAI